MTVILAGILGLGSSACGAGYKDYESGGIHEENIGVTDEKFIENGVSDYKIVIPADADGKVTFAKDELVMFIRQATGCQLPFVTDENLAFDSGAKFLSIGDTNILKTCGIKFDKEYLTHDGYRVITRGSTVLMAGGSSQGDLNAVYGFLKHTVGFVVYASDEIKVNSVRSLNLPDFDITDIPDFAQRQLAYYAIGQDAVYRDRMKIERHGERWTYGGHSHFSILPKETYYENHKDWYSPEGTQLCLTNDEMKAEFISRLKIIISAHPNDDYILLGQEDNAPFCSCSRCLADIEKYGTASAVLMRFTNSVAAEIKQWLDLSAGGRKLMIGTFAYQTTYTPPATYNVKNKIWTPNDPSVVTGDNVFVMIAPIEANYSYPFDSEQNLTTQQGLEGWQSVCDRFAVWSYAANFHCYVVNFNNFGILQSHYRSYLDISTETLVDMGAWDTASPAFDALRIYLHSNLMWNVNSDVPALIDDFIDNYYKIAADEIKEYFDYITTYMTTLRVTQGIDSTLYVDMNKTDYWSKSYIDKCMDIFDRALAKTEALKTSDAATYEKLQTRIRVERLSTIYLLMTLYQSRYSTTEQAAFADEFESYAARHHITHWYESTNLQLGDNTVVKMLANWRARIR